MTARRRAGQSVVEYILIIGIAVTALTVMGPAIKRGMQSVLKATSDQLAAQQDAEQDVNSSEHLNLSETASQTVIADTLLSSNYSTTNIVNQTVYTNTGTVTDMGFTPTQ